MKIIILAGGSGTRLWPVSRARSPKQVQPLFGKKTLLQITYSRIKKGFKETDIFISTSQKHLKDIRKQLPKIKKSQLIVEPVAKNTAAAIGLACITLAKKDPKSIIATVNSDHFIKDEKEYLRLIKLAGQTIQKYPDHLVLLGINPTYPDTGLGYIKLGKQLKSFDKDKLFKIDSFTEKPDLKTAKKYLKSWAYLWNPAYFVFQVDTMLSLFKKHLPGQHKILMAIKKSPAKLKLEFSKVKPTSIDYGIIEKAKKMLCLPANFDWADIGHWQTVQEILASKKSDNVVKGKYIHIDGSGNLVYSYSNKLVATIGVKNSIIIETKDAILVCPKNRAQDVKKIVERLKKEGLTSYL